jgi:hypothetical protein
LADPPRKPPRPFEADYPGAVSADGQGRLLADMEGRPLTAEYVLGRKNIGGEDVGLASYPEALQGIAEATNGRKIESVPQSRLGRFGGRVLVEPVTGRPVQVEVSKSLAPEAGRLVSGHEVGHAIDQAAGEIATAGLTNELRPLYDTLLTGRERTSKFSTPSGFGYKGDEIPREYMAEAIRAYMTDPNYIKTVAPKTAARIRAAVNAHPKLSRIVQFNAAALAVLAARSGEKEGASGTRQPGD